MEFTPDRCELLCFLRAEFDDALLEELARLDPYDDWPSDWNLPVLRYIFSHGAVPDPFGPDPVNICLYLSNRGTDLATPLAPDKRREQLLRLFASWILLNAYTRPGTFKPGCSDEEDELPVWALTQSSLALGPACIRPAARFVAWAQLAGEPAHRAYPGEHLYYLLSLLILRCAAPDQFDLPGTLAVYERFVAEAKQAHPVPADDLYTATLLPSQLPPSSGVFGVPNDFDRNNSQQRWARLAAWALDRLWSAHSHSSDPCFAPFRPLYPGRSR